MGFTRSYISQIEAGVKQPGPKFLRELARWESSQEGSQVSNPRTLIKIARERAGLSQAELARKIGYEIGVVQAVEDSGARITEKMVDAICKVLPLEKEDLLAGSDHPPITSEEPGLWRTVGQKPNVMLPKGMTARVIPLVSWAQAGTLACFWDEAYQYEGIVAFDVTDRKAIAVTIRGDSMRPQYDEGDVVILTPSSEARNGDLVIARLKEEAGDDVMFKIFQSTGGGQRVVLSSYNPAYPPLEFSRDDFRWIYPAQSVIKTLRK